MQITQIDPSEIEVSEILKAIPDAPPEIADPIIADIVARGIDVPLILGKDQELLDGRIRLRAAFAAGLPSVPCIVREDGDAMAATIILASLCHRKHYTK
jgi:ParB-like chromosome segregation protein Spo0J